MDNDKMETRQDVETFMAYWAHALDGPWHAAKLMVQDEPNGEWRELVSVANGGMPAE